MSEENNPELILQEVDAKKVEKNSKKVEVESQKESDLSFGELCENKVLKFLNEGEYKENPLEKTDKFNTWDFINSDACIELKSRRCASTDYPTTMIGENKMVACYNDRKAVWNSVLREVRFLFLFLFTDGLYYWDFNPNEYQVNKGGRKDRGKEEFKRYAYINMNNLKLLSSDITS